MRVVVDLNLCEANGMCMGFAPDVFELTDTDELLVLQEHPDESLRASVEEAVQFCPRQAVSIKE